MTPNGKAGRDVTLVGLTTLLVAALCERLGVDPYLGGTVALAAGGLVSRLYRYIRARSKFLQELDPA